ncbi:MAG: FmdB family transcriptional regulator [Thermodesulfovibrio sp. RBG_19FT_COMBO_42_12]|nr:MAG: FmdB family transcriptional regulator [Thermodesulfovibrio sp. RBG_19FT_COMBO_42_12]HZX48963.1 zinc ribbon domain-containing protein [Nitrospirota bacterium]
MPIYEYRCNNCRKKVAVLILNRSDQAPVCSHCGSNELTRLFSRFAAPKSEEARLESMADPSKWGDVDEDNPASMAKFMKKMGKEFGDELGEDFEQEVESAVEEASKGEDGSPDTFPPDL